jgi:predicted RNA methylase
MTHATTYIWRYGDIDVIFHPDLDGDGTNQAPSFVSFIRGYFGAEQRFGTVFEWCCGPAFIGFALLAEGLCESLCLADINPLAIDYVNRTVRANGLQDRVRSYVSNNLASISPLERFDLVVGNPPNYYSLNPAHPDYYWLKNDLRPNDPGWKVHAGFYSQIAAFLNPGAFVLVEEVEPYARLVYDPIDSPIPWDIRPEPPAAVFAEMISQGGLQPIADRQFHTDRRSGLKMWLQISQKRPNGLNAPEAH